MGDVGSLSDPSQLWKDHAPIGDYSSEANDIIRSSGIISENDLELALQQLHQIEKKARLAYDGSTGVKVCMAILDLVRKKKILAEVLKTVTQLCRRRGQLRKVVAEIIHCVSSWIEDYEEEDKIALLETLEAVTEGKIYVEVERARLLKQQATIYANRDDITQAIEHISQAQPETYNGMPTLEKLEYLLFHIKLLLRKGDFIRTQLVSNRINKQWFDETELGKHETDETKSGVASPISRIKELELTYYEYLIHYHIHQEEYMEAAECYGGLLEHPSIKINKELWQEIAMERICNLCLSSYSEKQQKYAQELLNNSRIDKDALSRYLGNCIISKEIVDWPLERESEIVAVSCFKDYPHPGGMGRLEKLKKRFIQHNIRICELYYTRITIDRMSQILNISREQVESELAEVVCDKMANARINQASGIVRFGKLQTASCRIDSWIESINMFLPIVDEATHLIQKERMVHNTTIASSRGN